MLRMSDRRVRGRMYARHCEGKLKVPQVDKKRPARKAQLGRLAVSFMYVDGKIFASGSLRYHIARTLQLQAPPGSCVRSSCA